MRRVITDGGPGTEFWQAFETFERSAWRWEQQPAYWMGYEREQFDKFLAGEPESPLKNPDLAEWMAQVSRHVAEGKTYGRVRIVDDPMTEYQRWMQWMDRWNREAGEEILYLSRAGAVEAEIFPGIGPDDWWLFDDRRLLVMHHNAEGRRIWVEALEDEPEVGAAVEWRRRAIATARNETARRFSAPRGREA